MNKCEHPKLRVGDTFDQLRVVEPCLFCRLAAAERERDELREIVRWALGERDEFPAPPESVIGKPKYWWRRELKRRFDAAREGK